MILLLIFFLVSAMTITTANISEDQVVIATYTQELIKIEEIRNIEKPLIHTFSRSLKRMIPPLTVLENNGLTIIPYPQIWGQFL